MKRTIFALAICLICNVAYAWEGIDQQGGELVEIERNNLVRSGKNIEIFDYQDNNYHDVDIERIDRYGNTVEIEVYDWYNGEYRTLEMDGTNH